MTQSPNTERRPIQTVTFHKPLTLDPTVNRQPTIGKRATFIHGGGLPNYVVGEVLDAFDDKCVVALIGDSVSPCDPSWMEVSTAISIPEELGATREHTYRVPLDYIVSAE